MRYRTLGKTALRVSEIGYGTWGIGKSGWIGAEDKESLAALPKTWGLRSMLSLKLLYVTS